VSPGWNVMELTLVTLFQGRLGEVPSLESAPVAAST
jgi:hypothetical protein